MLNDVLLHDERLRLEALAQSIAYHAKEYTSHVAAPVEIIDTATEFEGYIRAGKQLPPAVNINAAG